MAEELRIPDVLELSDGTRVGGVGKWEKLRREEILELFTREVYGRVPFRTKCVKIEPDGAGKKIYNGTVIQQKSRITAIAEHGMFSFPVWLYYPSGVEQSFPVFVYCMLRTQAEQYDLDGEEHMSFVPVEEITARGYAVVIYRVTDIAPDEYDGFQSGVFAALDQPRGRDSWGTIAAWAWAGSRVMDYICSDTKCFDPSRACIVGHSRGGKVALCAAIYDERIALCAPNGSGCGGAGCFRFLGGRYGEGIGLCETAGSINDMLGYWWTDAFGEFGARQKRYTRSNFPVAKNQMEFMANFSLDKLGTLQDEDRLPFDMHFAKALIAPRALITTDGLGDVWANTFGTQVTWRAAQEVFDFLGVPEKNALHFREGKHEFQAADWIAIVDFCDEMFFGKTSANNIVSFRPVQQAGTPMDVMMERMDWRKTKLHYTWSNPLEDM